MKLALRGALGVVGLGAAVLLMSAYGLESWRFTSAAIITFRVIVGTALGGLIGFLLVRPLMRSTSDEQVALYLEEHEPSLQAAIISAVEAEHGGSGSPFSATLVRRLVESAVEKVRAIENGRRVERVPVRRYSAMLGVITVAAIALFTLVPHICATVCRRPHRVARRRSGRPLQHRGHTGNATVARGPIRALRRVSRIRRRAGIADDRKTPEAAYERVPLLRSESDSTRPAVRSRRPLEYFVEENGVNSSTPLKVVDLPYVQRLELEYHFPAYTGLAPQKVEDGGDIAVLKGTEVRVRAVPTMTASAGQIVLGDNDRSGLAPDAAGGSPAPLIGAFKVNRDGFYHIELDAPSGERMTASPLQRLTLWTISRRPCRLPSLAATPSASPIEEVFVEARAEDDYGVRDLDLVYSVNGGTEKTIRLFDGKKRMPEVSGGHTFYLEELGVQPGDFVSYYAKAADNDAVQGAKPAMSDMYFVRIRPLSKEFRRAPSDAGGGGGGGGGQQNRWRALRTAASIIAATFNVQPIQEMTATSAREQHGDCAVSVASARPVEGR